MFAAAPRDRPGFLDFGLQRRETRAFVRAVAKRLALGPAARAPEIGAGFGLLDEGESLGNDWFIHSLVTIFQSAKNANGDIGDEASQARHKMELRIPNQVVARRARRQEVSSFKFSVFSKESKGLEIGAKGSKTPRTPRGNKGGNDR